MLLSLLPLLFSFFITTTKAFYQAPRLNKPFFLLASQKTTSKQIKIKSISPDYTPRGPNQERYVQFLQDPNTDIVLGVGPAGSGKTLFACYTAVQELRKGSIQKIIMTRPLVSVDKEDIGYLPGNLVSKMDPWTRPIFDILLEFFSQQEINNLVQSGIIEISPLAYMRGRTFKNTFLIADEMQNSSPNQMLMMTTRLGQGTKLVITGDLKQSDREDTQNGLLDFIQKWKRTAHQINETNRIELVELDASDIERSPVVKKILQMYEPVPYIPNPIKRPQPPLGDCAMIPYTRTL
jgi:phosphate starvation-inducible PhoH-like protein